MPVRVQIFVEMYFLGYSSVSSLLWLWQVIFRKYKSRNRSDIYGNFVPLREQDTVLLRRDETHTLPLSKRSRGTLCTGVRSILWCNVREPRESSFERG